jgi:hypothetical protein
MKHPFGFLKSMSSSAFNFSLPKIPLNPPLTKGEFAQRGKLPLFVKRGARGDFDSHGT